MIYIDLPAHLVKELPNTDTRFRTDQRLFEDGKIDEAENEKQRLEQKQREWRKSLEASGQKWIPQWFEYTKDEHSENGFSWKYRGGYWESRGNFKNCLDLY
jgi:oxysterol-binding protein-related protein 3/6/7